MTKQIAKINKKYFNSFSIGYDGSRDFFERIVLPYKKYIRSIYAVPPLSSGLSNARWALKTSPTELLNFRKNVQKTGKEFNLVFNFNGVTYPRKQFSKKLLDVTNFYSPDMVIISGTYLLDILRETKYKIGISIIHDINTANQLEMLME